MKQKRQKRAVLFLCAILTCMGLLCGTASAATLVVIDLADVVDGAAPNSISAACIWPSNSLSWAVVSSIRLFNRSALKWLLP